MLEDDILTELARLNRIQQKEVLDYIQSLGLEESESFENERAYPRTSKKIEVDVLINDKLIKSDSRDISASGVFVGTKAKVEEGQPAKVVLTIPGQSIPFKLDGNVVRTESDGFAVYFGDVSSFARQALAEVLEG